MDKSLGDIYRPGDHVFGLIKYNIPKDMIFKDITASLKGVGYAIRINTEVTPSKKYYNPPFLKANETYVSIQTSLLAENNQIVAMGYYTEPFNFILPPNIPSSLCYNKFSYSFQISYYVKVEFEEVGFFNTTKRFSNEITVISPIVSILPSGPVMTAIQKNITKIFGGDNGHINLKATVEKSLVAPGDTLNMAISVENKSTEDATVIIKLLRRITLKANDDRIKICDKELPEYEVKTDAVNRGNSKHIATYINIPKNAFTIQHSKIISRDYVLKFILKISAFYCDGEMEIPVMIGEFPLDSGNAMNSVVPLSAQIPPLYSKGLEENTKKK